jgi:hypothetical protein
VIAVIRRTIAAHDAEFGAGSAACDLAAGAELLALLAFQLVGVVLLADVLAGAAR